MAVTLLALLGGIGLLAVAADQFVLGPGMLLTQEDRPQAPAGFGDEGGFTGERQPEGNRP